jgi:hypothetical protein
VDPELLEVGARSVLDRFAKLGGSLNGVVVPGRSIETVLARHALLSARIFAPRTDASEINGLRGAEIWCIKVRYPPICDGP